METKPIFIIDCFVQSTSIEQKLINCLATLKRNGQDTMLITNTPVEKHVAELCKYLIYDSENHLFDEMPSDPISLYKLYQNFEIHEFIPGVQRHGLSVLRNLGKATKIAKLYGYTHFHRIEVDDLMGTESMNKILKIPEEVEGMNKKGLFIFNQSDISFHYMYCSIDTFLEDIPQIEHQEQYVAYLSGEMQSERYRNVEDFFRHALDQKNSDVIRVDGTQLGEYFPDTLWNTETSQSNISEKHRGCTTGFYRTYRGGTETGEWTILSYNYSERNLDRKIRVDLSDGSGFEIKHSLFGKGYWQYNIVPANAEKLHVYEEDELIYTCSSSNTGSYVVLR